MRFAIGLMAALAVFMAAPAPAQVRVGLVAPDASTPLGQDFRIPFARGMAAAGANARVTQALLPATTPDIVEQVRRLIEVDQVTMVALAGPMEAVTLLARRHQQVGFFHLGVLGAGEAMRLAEFRNLVSFGPLPREQREFLVANLAAGAEPAIVAEPLFGSTMEQVIAEIGRVNANTKPRPFLVQPPEPAEIFAARLLEMKPTAIGAILSEAATEAAARLLYAGGYRDPVAMFAPPPLRTRSYTAGRMIGLAIAEGARTGADIIAAIETAPRFAGETRSVALAWGLRASGLMSAVPVGFYGPDKRGIDNTTECFCQDGSGRRVSYKSCEPGKCRTYRNNTDDCSTECARE